MIFQIKQYYEQCVLQLTDIFWVELEKFLD